MRQKFTPKGDKRPIAAKRLIKKQTKKRKYDSKPNLFLQEHRLGRADIKSGGSYLPPLAWREPLLSSTLLTAALLTAALLLTLTLLAVTFLFFAVLVLALSRSPSFTRFVWIPLCVHITFLYYLNWLLRSDWTFFNQIGAKHDLD